MGPGLQFGRPKIAAQDTIVPGSQNVNLTKPFRQARANFGRRKAMLHTRHDLLVTSGAFLVGLALAGFGAYTILTKNAFEESLQNARILIEGASAIPSYTADSIRPLLEQQMKVQFLPHSIPSF